MLMREYLNENNELIGPLCTVCAQQYEDDNHGLVSPTNEYEAPADLCTECAGWNEG